jgi:hypothetical protein
MAEQIQCANCRMYTTWRSSLGNPLVEIPIAVLQLIPIIGDLVYGQVWERNWLLGRAKARCRTCEFEFTINDYPDVKAKRELIQRATEEEARRNKEGVINQIIQAQERNSLSNASDSDPQTRVVDIKKCMRCGVENPQQFKYCGNCGAPLSLPLSKL